MRKLFKYIEPLWLGRDEKISLRSVGAIVLITDFVINLHNSTYVLIKVLNLIMGDKTVDAAVIASLSGYLAQIAMILGIEAALIAALLALKAYQPFQGFQTPGSNGPGYYNATVESKTTVLQQPPELVVEQPQ
jgi:hypothetical protein